MVRDNDQKTASCVCAARRNFRGGPRRAEVGRAEASRRQERGRQTCFPNFLLFFLLLFLETLLVTTVAMTPRVTT